MMGAVKALWRLPRRDRQSPPFRLVFGRGQDVLHGVLARGQSLGAIRTDLPEDLLLGMVVALDEECDRWLADQWDKLSRAEIERLWTSMLATFARVLGPLPRPRVVKGGGARRRARARRSA
jgi:hypothetical protein